MNNEAKKVKELMEDLIKLKEQLAVEKIGSSGISMGIG